MAKSGLTLYNPMNYSTEASLSFTIFWNLLKLMSIESVTPSNHLILLILLLMPPPSPPALNPSQHQGLFQRVGSSHQVTKRWELQQESFQ